ncbi:hypothetical protein RHMOL_Rhmol09G0268100 [Rhododendron molle]|uniref:Uncharacterized protein n=2 Tax=Rhododendron molle TaxID=49168 RepID=A0ACC0MHG8_RHOML|nr:hypothetical protein RHMOL_Rhmol09G0268100 [Rhododendron molle]KAI8540492.1 hypothetical protein RHMOL_Rhmol09G0268100 [Rhododendron molle]
MPFCYVGSYQAGGDSLNNNGTKIFYRTYGHGPVKVLMIIGLAGTHDSWHPQIKGLTGTVTPNDDDQFPAADEGNNGVENKNHGKRCNGTNGSFRLEKSPCFWPFNGWRKANVFGHSMGAMIACKLAALVPDRVLSLALLNVTGGGYECFPKLDRQTLSIAIRFWRAKTPEQRAAVDLDTHYSKEYLEEYVGPNTRRSILFQEYVKGISASGMQSNHGFDGQANACWRHEMSTKELESICSAGFLISVIHGRSDIIAQLYYARRLAEKLQPCARMIELHGGHLVSHERTDEVNQALAELINASEANVSPCDWGTTPKRSPGWAMTRISLGRTNFEGGSKLSIVVVAVEKMHIFLLYLLSLVVLLFEYIRRALRSLKPVKVGSAIEL